MADNKVVLVTGGAKGIGFACVRRFLEDGQNVIIADSDEAAGDQAVSELETFAPRLKFFACDISDGLSVHNLVAASLNAFGRIDVLVNNAGITSPGGLLDGTVEEFDKVLATNLRGSFLVSKAVCEWMVSEIESRMDRSRLSDRPYTIINMSSVNDTVALDGYLAYTVSKGGIRQMTRAMAIELAPYGIRVNAIGPGSVKTPLLDQVVHDPRALELLNSRTPLGRMAHPDEIAGVAAFLASDDASYMTGECVYVDGGRLALNMVMPRLGDEDVL